MMAHCKIHGDCLVLNEMSRLWRTARISKSYQEFWPLVVDSRGDLIALHPEIFPLVSPHLEFAGDCGIRSKCLPGA